MATKVGGLTITLRARTEEFTRGMKRAETRMRKFSRQARGVTQALGAFGPAFGVAGAAFFTAAMLRRQEQFNRAMQRSLAIMGDVSNVMRRDMVSAAREMAGATSFSARELAEGFFFLASAGLDAQQSLEALPVVARFAQAGHLGLARGTELLTDVMAGFGIKVKDATQNMKNMTEVADLLVKANTTADATTQQFAESLAGPLSSAARQAGVSLQQTVAMLSVLADIGIKSKAAGTALGIVLRDLQFKGVKNAGAFEKLGITIFRTSDGMIDLIKTFEDFETTFSGAQQKEFISGLIDLGLQQRSIKFLKVFVGLTNEMKEAFVDAMQAMDASADVAESSMTDLEKATNALSGAWGELADILTPPVFSFIAVGAELATDALKALKGEADGIKDVLGFLLFPTTTVLNKVNERLGREAFQQQGLTPEGKFREGGVQPGQAEANRDATNRLFGSPGERKSVEKFAKLRQKISDQIVDSIKKERNIFGQIARLEIGQAEGEKKRQFQINRRVKLEKQYVEAVREGDIARQKAVGNAQKGEELRKLAVAGAPGGETEFLEKTLARAAKSLRRAQLDADLLALGTGKAQAAAHRLFLEIFNSAKFQKASVEVQNEINNAFLDRLMLAQQVDAATKVTLESTKKQTEELRKQAAIESRTENIRKAGQTTLETFAEELRDLLDLPIEARFQGAKQAASRARQSALKGQGGPVFSPGALKGSQQAFDIITGSRSDKRLKALEKINRGIQQVAKNTAIPGIPSGL